jgi:hypothetical protein
MKRIFPFLLALAILAALPTSHAFAMTYIATTFFGTPNPLVVHKNGFETMLVETNGADQISVSVVPQSALKQEFKVKSIQVSLNGTVVCTNHSLVENCLIGDTNPGDEVSATLYYQGKQPGVYETLWTISHDGWVTVYGSGGTIINKTK